MDFSTVIFSLIQSHFVLFLHNYYFHSVQFSNADRSRLESHNTDVGGIYLSK